MLFPLDLGRKENLMSDSTIPYKIYLSEDELPRILVQRPCGYESQTRSSAQSEIRSSR